MYRDIWINKENYQEKLNERNPDNFRVTGGMFVVPGEEEIARIMQSDDSCFALARAGGEIAASFWISYHDPAFIGFESQDTGLKAAMDERRVFHLRELVVANPHLGRKIPQSLYYTIMVAIKEAGFTHSLFEIYKVDSYFDGARHDVGLLNERSIHSAFAAGAYAAGNQPRRTVRLDGFAVDITPVVLVLDHERAMPSLECQLAESEVVIRRGNSV